MGKNPKSHSEHLRTKPDEFGEFALAMHFNMGTPPIDEFEANLIALERAEELLIKKTDGSIDKVEQQEMLSLFEMIYPSDGRKAPHNSDPTIVQPETQQRLLVSLRSWIGSYRTYFQECEDFEPVILDEAYWDALRR